MLGDRTIHELVTTLCSVSAFRVSATRDQLLKGIPGEYACPREQSNLVTDLQLILDFVIQAGRLANGELALDVLWKNVQMYVSPATQTGNKLDKLFEALRQNGNDIQGKPGKTSILFINAEPRDLQRLRVTEEFKKIKYELETGSDRDSFELQFLFDARREELSRELLRIKPHIVHFAGHGSADGAIYLLDEHGFSDPVSGAALGMLFEVLGSHASRQDRECGVILNACFTETMSQAIRQHVDFVIGMDEAIADPLAVAFSIGFYQALGNGFDSRKAFKAGLAQMEMAGHVEENRPLYV